MALYLDLMKKKKYEHNWRNINLAKEFEKHGDFVLGNLMNRISLLISEITSSFGQSPIVLPPTIISEEKIEQNNGEIQFPDV